MSDEIQVEGEELPHLLLVDDDDQAREVMAELMDDIAAAVHVDGTGRIQKSE